MSGKFVHHEEPGKITQGRPGPARSWCRCESDTHAEACAAQTLGVGVAFLASRARDGVVPFIQAGRSRRYSEENLAEIKAGWGKGAMPAPNRWGQTDRSQARAS